MSEVKLSSDVTPDVAEAYLVTLGELAEHRQQASQLGERISGIDADAEQFVSRVKSLCSEVAPELAPMPIGDCITSLGKKLTDCQRDESVRNQQTAKRNQAENQLVQANESARRGRDQFNELCLAAGLCLSPSDSVDDETADDDSSRAFQWN